MSVNKNRAYLSKAEDGTTYSRYLIKHLFPPYWDEDYNWKCGDFSNHKGRSYKTWKHNRKTQWKEKKLNLNKE